MRKSIFIVFVLCLCVFTSNAQSRRKKAAPPPPRVILSGSESKQPDVIVERYVSSYEINADGTAVQTLEMKRKFTNQATAERARNYENLFNADLQSVEVLEAGIVKSNGKTLILPAASIAIKPTAQAEAAPAFSSLKLAAITFDDLNANDAAFFKLRIAQKKPIFKNHFDAVEILPALYEWKTAEINVVAPKDYPLFVEAVDLAGGKLPDAGDGRTRWQWGKQNFAAIPLEPATISVVDFSPRVAITSFESYEQLGAAYWAEAKTQAVVTPEIRRLADEITKDRAEPAEQAAAIYEWANRNVRYLSIVLGRGGWVPHHTAEILVNRSGDCKDYTALIGALLAAKNIESHPVIVRADGGYWFPKVAAPEYFNHAILYIPALQMYADATAPNTRLGLLPFILNGKQAFLAGEKTGTVLIPPGAPEGNQAISTIEATFAANGDLTARSKNTYSGRSEMVSRSLFSDSRSLGDEAAFFRVLLAYYGLNGTGKLLKLGDPHQTNAPFGVEMEISLPDHTTFVPNGTLSVPVALNLTNLLELEKFVVPAERKTDLPLGANIMRETLRINFPPNVRVETVPGGVQLENAVGVYKLAYELQNNQVVVRRELTFKRDVVSPVDYPQLRELIQKLAASYNDSIGYRADKSLLAAKSAQLKRYKPQKSVVLTEVLAETFDASEMKPLTPRQAAALEIKLKATPADVKIRKRLLTHYSDSRRLTVKRQERIRHALWLLENQPLLFDEKVYDLFNVFESAADPVYTAVKTEWVKQIEAHLDEPLIRLNAARFVAKVEGKVAEELLLAGEKLFSQDYRFANQLFELYEQNLPAEIKPTAAAAATVSAAPIQPVATITAADNFNVQTELQKPLNEVLAKGEKALTLIKRERSDERDEARAALLPKLAAIAFRAGNLTTAKTHATELILEFGDEAKNRTYSISTHTGNIVLGRIALRENNQSEAAKFLLIAGRAPQRAAFNAVTPDLTLAGELLEKGDRQTVIEYLRLCEDFVFANKETMQRWQTEIKAGKTPDFIND